METPKYPPFLPFLIASFALALIGWAGLYYIVVYTLPTLGPRWFFYFLTTLAVTGTVLPIVYFLNRRFPSQPPADTGVIVRQALWAGVYADILIWLQLGGVLSFALVIFIALGLVLIEFFLRLRERARFQPENEEANG